MLLVLFASIINYIRYNTNTILHYIHTYIHTQGSYDIIHITYIHRVVMIQYYNTHYITYIHRVVMIQYYTTLHIIHRVVMILVIYINLQWMVQLMMERCMNLMLQYHYPLRVGRIGH